MGYADEKLAFAARLNEVCSDADMPERGRQTALAAKFQVTPNAARKWLLGLGMPEYEVAVAIAKWGGVNFEWLMTGRGPKTASTRIDMKTVVLDEALRSFPSDERREVLGFIKYKLQSAKARYTGEQLARYNTALDRFAEAPPPPAPPPSTGDDAEPPPKRH